MPHIMEPDFYSTSHILRRCFSPSDWSTNPNLGRTSLEYGVHPRRTTWISARLDVLKLIISKYPPAFTPENKVCLGWLDDYFQDAIQTSCEVFRRRGFSYTPLYPPEQYRAVHAGSPFLQSEEFVSKLR